MKQRLRILIVEDDPDAAGMIAELVSWWDHKARVAYDAPTALAIAKEFAPDVILVDLGLGETSGYDLALGLREAAAPRTVRIFTISGGAEDPVRAAAAGIEAHLIKPEVSVGLAALIGPDRR